MTRTKQTKPRHIVEESVTNEESSPEDTEMGSEPLNEDEDNLNERDTADPVSKIESWVNPKSNSSLCACDQDYGQSAFEIAANARKANVQTNLSAKSIFKNENVEKKSTDDSSSYDLAELRSSRPVKFWTDNDEINQKESLLSAHNSHCLQMSKNEVPGQRVDISTITKPGAHVQNEDSHLGNVNNLKDQSKKNYRTSSNPFLNNSFRQSDGDYGISDPTRHPAAATAMHQYMSAMKMLTERHGLSNANNVMLESFRAWEKLSRPASSQYNENVSNATLVNSYLTQLTEAWNSMMIHQFSKADISRFHPYQGDNRKNYARNGNVIPLPEITQYHNFYDKRLSPKEDNMRTTPLSTGSPSRNTSSASSLKNEKNGESCALRGETTISDRKENDTNENAPNKTEKSHPELEDFVSARRAPSPLNIPKQSLASHLQQNTPLSAPALGHDGFAHLAVNPFPYRPWSTSSWLGYSSPKLSSFPDQYSYPRFFPIDDAPFRTPAGTQEKLSPRSVHKVENELSGTTTFSKTSVDEVQFHNLTAKLPSSAMNEDSNLANSNLQQRKLSDPTAYLKKAESNSYLQEMRHQYNLPHPSFNLPWFGAGLSQNSLNSPKISHVNSSQALNKSNSQLFFPPGIPTFSSTSYPLGSSAPQSYQGNFPYKPESSLSHSPTSGKLNSRRCRTRGVPIDSVHAAIVREAKEQFKGIDPENMYIQCPICQKRIKRLYHFQRHMRIHTGEKTHQCPCCQYKSVRKDNLKSHMKTHEKQNFENGRKSGKSNHESHRSCETVDEKAYNFSVGRHFDSKTFSKENNSSAISAVQRERKTSEPKTQRNSPHEINWNDVTNHSNQVSFPTPYASPTFSKESNAMLPPDTSHQNSSLKKEHFGFKNDSDELSRRKIFRYSPHNEIATNGNFNFEDREKYLRVADLVSFTSGVNHQKTADAFDDIEPKKRSHSGLDVPQDLTIRKDELNSKRQKLTKSDLEPTKKSASSSVSYVPMNVNNNNDRKSNVQIIENPESSTSSYFRRETNPHPTSKIYQPPLGTKKDEHSLSAIKSRLTSTSSTTPPAIFSAVSDRNGAEQNAIRTSPPDDTSPISFDEKRHVKTSSPSLSTSADFSSFTNLRPSTTQSPVSRACDYQSDLSVPSLQSHNVSQVIPSSAKEKEAKKFSQHKNPKDIKMKVSAAKSEASFSIPSSFHHNVQEATTSHKTKKHQESLLKDTPGSAKRKEDITFQTKNLSCRLCSFTSSSSTELQSHVTAMHKQDGFYKCDKCNYLGKNLSKLVEHIRIHTGERPFKCDQCSYAAKRKDNLGQHKAVRHDKRKSKGSNVYSVVDQVNRETSASSTSAAGGNPRVNDKKKDSAGISPSAPLSEAFPLFSDVHFYPKMDVLPEYSYGKDSEKNVNPLASASLTTSFPSFPRLHALPPAMFQYPIYPTPHILQSPDFSPTNSGKNVHNPGSYSLKIRAALISP